MVILVLQIGDVLRYRSQSKRCGVHQPLLLPSRLGEFWIWLSTPNLLYEMYSVVHWAERPMQWQATPSSLWLESHSEITPSHSWPLFPRQKFPRPWIFEIALSLSTNWIETKYKLNATPSNKRPTAVPQKITSSGELVPNHTSILEKESI